MRVALVVMPFASTLSPSLAAGLLQALLRKAGHECDVKYLNLDLESKIGLDTYRYFIKSGMTAALVTEWVFSQHYYARSFSSWDTYARDVLKDLPPRPRESLHERVDTLAAAVPSFVDDALASCEWGTYDLVGFTSTFEQTMPGVCLAAAIRRHHPAVKIAFGGSNFEWPMGSVYMELFPFIDYISVNEADDTFPDLCTNLARGVTDVPAGLLCRTADGSIGGGPRTTPFTRMDALPIPCYDDYRAATHRRGLVDRPRDIPVEGSRGCWWGEKHHCTFCGFSDETLTFRAKSAPRLLHEVAELERAHASAQLWFSDSIVAMPFFKTVLPVWASQEKPTKKFFEVKANLTRQQMALLASAGVTMIQPGLESLCDGTLKVMRKGVTAAQNIAVLKWARELGINVSWNILFGFPQEPLEGYTDTARLVELLVHLQPPEGVAPIRMDRFSPNFTNWRELGFDTIEPSPAYRHVWPLQNDRLMELAYCFEYTHPHSARVDELSAPIRAATTEWRKRFRKKTNGSCLITVNDAGHYVLIDTRYTRPSRVQFLQKAEVLLLAASDSPGRRDAIVARVRERHPDLRDGTVLRDDTVRSALDRLEEIDVIAEVGQLLINVAMFDKRARHALTRLEAPRLEDTCTTRPTVLR